jgi:hypothetical protein
MEAPNYRDWITAELARSAPWAAQVERRRAEALRPRRTASGFSIASYRSPEGLEGALEDWRGRPRSERPFAWREERVASSSWNPAPNEPLEHTRRYRRGLASDEKSWIGASAAAALHNLYCSPSGYLPNLPSTLARYPAPTGGQASLAAAKITGASWGASPARRQAFFRASPKQMDLERFTALFNSRPPQA